MPRAAYGVEKRCGDVRETELGQVVRQPGKQRLALTVVVLSHLAALGSGDGDHGRRCGD